MELARDYFLDILNDNELTIYREVEQAALELILTRRIQRDEVKQDFFEDLEGDKIFYSCIFNTGKDKCVNSELNYQLSKWFVDHMSRLPIAEKFLIFRFDS